MIWNDSDKAWEYYGKTDPYFGVITWEKFRSEQLTEAAQAEFFRSGERHVEAVLQTVREQLVPGFRPVRALDFGCGVGRVTLPLARVAASVVGVDVSEAMLAEARRNAERQGLANVTFVPSDDALSRVAGPFDLVHSHIVFQHIPRRRGEALFRRLVDLLAEGGVGVLQFTYYRRSPWWKKRLIALVKAVPFLFGVQNWLRGRPFREPAREMNEYDLSLLFRTLHENGCHRCAVRFTDHGMYGLVLLFQKTQMDLL
jgi:SAM-dependent methyltransferase